VRKGESKELEETTSKIADDQHACTWESVNDEVTREVASD
jgi:hypothetical protein